MSDQEGFQLPSSSGLLDMVDLSLEVGQDFVSGFLLLVLVNNSGQDFDPTLYIFVLIL